MAHEIYLAWLSFDDELFGPCLEDTTTIEDLPAYSGTDYILVGSVLPDFILYQRGTGFWCASEWVQFPPQFLWNHGELHTTVSIANLNLANTLVELRILGGWRQNVLATREGEMWGSTPTFVPFKDPNPGGYQGVYVKPQNIRIDSGWICVRDTGNHILEIY